MVQQPAIKNNDYEQNPSQNTNFKNNSGLDYDFRLLN